MKKLTIALSLILSLGIFGCHDKDYSPTSFNETGSVTPDRPSPTDDPFISVCGGVSFEDVTEDSGDVFCTYPDDPPGTPEPVTPEPVTPEPVTPEPRLRIKERAIVNKFFIASSVSNLLI